LEQEEASLRAGQRREFDAGHERFGPQVVGTIHIESAGKKSAAFLVRNGRGGPSGEYRFGFALNPTAYNWGANLFEPEAKPKIVPLSRGGNGINWVEMTNLNRFASNVLNFIAYSNDGTKVLDAQLEIPAGQHFHLYANSLLSPGQTGILKIESADKLPYIAQSVFYFFNDSFSELTSAYTSKAKVLSIGEKLGSWNLFLGMFNWLKIYNSTERVQRIRIVVNRGGIDSERTFFIFPFWGTDFGLHESAFWGTASEEYGTFRVIADEPDAIYSEILRGRFSAPGVVDYLMPIPLESRESN
jgi:hypothetical protein